MRFFEEDDGGGGGGDGELSHGAAALTNEPTEVVETPPAPAAPTVDAAALAKSLGAEIAGAMRQQQQSEPAKRKTVDDLTPEEAEKLLNVWKPTKEWTTKFDNLETRDEAVKEMRDGVVKHNDTIGQYRIREALDGVHAQYKPVLEFMQRYENEQAEKRFNTAHPELAKPEYKKVVEAVANDLQRQGKKFDSEKELFDELSKGVEAVFKVSNPNFKLSAGSNPAAKTTKGQSTNGIPVTTPGAGGGGGGKGNDAEVKRGIAIFGK